MLVRIPSADRVPGLPGGIYPYVGGSIGIDGLRDVVHDYGYAAVPGISGVRLAGEVPDTLADPAEYAANGPSFPVPDSPLFEYDDWLERQRQAKVSLVLTDSDRIRKSDEYALRDALKRWRNVSDPVMAVLPIDSWWLRDGLGLLTEEARSAGRPVGLVLHHFFNGLDDRRAVAGLTAFLAAVPGIPIILLRCDVSGIGAVAHGAHAAFIGNSATRRHGPMPLKRRDSSPEDRDTSPGVFVPALHAYFKASQLPAFSRGEDDDLLACHDQFCRGRSLLRFSRLSENDPQEARLQVNKHNAASHERVAQTVFGSAEPRDTWWELCRSGADTAASLTEHGVSLPVSRWQRQWLELGSPAHHPAGTR
jgi:hypothetical protein